MENSDLSSAAPGKPLTQKQPEQPASATCERDSIDAWQAEIESRRAADQFVYEPLKATPSRMPNVLPAEVQALRDKELAERERQRVLDLRWQRWGELLRQRGNRYQGCKLSSFEAAEPDQQRAVVRLRDYCDTIRDRIAGGEGLLFYGPKGTGKDHLAMAVARAAIGADFRVEWQNGMDLFGDIRDAMDKGEMERSLVARLVQPDVLYLSDPLPPLGALTEFQSSMLFRVLDGRYSRQKPTWCTVNVVGAKELDDRMGPQNGDRLRDGALGVFCNWPSYRRTRP